MCFYKFTDVQAAGMETIVGQRDLIKLLPLVRQQLQL